MMRNPAFYCLLAASSQLLLATLRAQSTAPLLTIQGLDQSSARAARSVAMGGAAIAVGRDASILFVNPAAMSQLSAVELRAGIGWNSYRTEQTQQWVPNRFYTNFSLLMENLIGMIKDPMANDTLVTDPWVRLQKPYDDLKPNWTETSSAVRPTVFSAAVPLEVSGMKVVAAVGVEQIFDLNYYYRNNNGLEPNIGLYRPEPIPVLRGSDTMVVRWFASASERKGAIYGITPAVSIDVLENLSLGLGVTILTGSSDDIHEEIDRGRLVFNAVYTFRNDSVYSRTKTTGTSTYSGVLPTLGVFHRERYFSIGAAVRLPGTVTRKWDQTATVTTTASSTVVTASGSDKVRLPLRYSLGFALYPGSRWNVGVDYVVRQYQNVEYTPEGGSGASKPWLGGNMLRAGAEYSAADWVTVRGGYREHVSVFAPQGAGLLDEPVRGSVYAAGVGLNFGTVGVDIAYEYTVLKYEDVWMTNVNDNKLGRHSVLSEFCIRF